jgi:hypothetical protein
MLLIRENKSAFNGAQLFTQMEFQQLAAAYVQTQLNLAQAQL